MGLSKKQATYGVVLLAAAGGFLWDRMTSTPAPAAGSEAVVQHTPHAPLAGPGNNAPRKAAAHAADAPQAANGAASAPTTGPVGLGERLASVARAWCLDSSAAESAFTVPPGWIKERPVDVPVDRPAAREQENPDRALADVFRRQHHLDAVMMGRRGGRGYAMVDGKGVFIGQTVDKFELLAVTKTSAVFGLREARVELGLPGGDTHIIHDGPGTEDARSENDDAIRK